ncbi:hypothetical protein Nepgr_033382 [Nepenthes gracilis]|uniref:Uncharacterized protein n=1 Tax=Nepenthes gracilis TaxID=150966 RepID=A0AAD3TMA1_NEPGR|nr:hypothetical protein Nepgr_033382 [Nepenthes gracilis]
MELIPCIFNDTCTMPRRVKHRHGLFNHNEVLKCLPNLKIGKSKLLIWSNDLVPRGLAGGLGLRVTAPSILPGLESIGCEH